MKNANPDLMAEALRARKGRGLDIKIIIGDPEEDEGTDKKNPDLAPEATLLGEDGEQSALTEEEVPDVEGAEDESAKGILERALGQAPGLQRGSILSRTKMRGDKK